MPSIWNDECPPPSTLAKPDTDNTYLWLLACLAHPDPNPSSPVSRTEPETQSNPLSQPTGTEVIDYIHSITVELKLLAEKSGMARLALILMLAEQEAKQSARRRSRNVTAADSKE